MVALLIEKRKGRRGGPLRAPPPRVSGARAPAYRRGRGKTQMPPAASVPVGVVHVRDVRMAVAHRAVAVRVRVRLAGGIAGPVLVQMMAVMHVRVGVLQAFMHMLVLMPFGQMQPASNGHQRAGRQQLQGQRLTESDERDDSSEKR